MDAVATCAMDTGGMLRTSSMSPKADDVAGANDSSNIMNRSSYRGTSARVGGNKKGDAGADLVAHEASSELLAMETEAEEYGGSVYGGGPLAPSALGVIEREAVAGVDSLAVDDTEQFAGAHLCPIIVVRHRLHNTSDEHAFHTLGSHTDVSACQSTCDLLMRRDLVAFLHMTLFNCTVHSK